MKKKLSAKKALGMLGINMNNKTKITNELSSTGLVICPVCNRPPSWGEGGKIFSSPMVRITISNLDALIHNGCLHQLYTDIDGQIRIQRRWQLIFGFLPACSKFLSGAASLVRLMFKHGVTEGLVQFKISQLVKKDVQDFFGRPGKVRQGGRIGVPKRTFVSGRK